MKRNTLASALALVIMGCGEPGQPAYPNEEKTQAVAEFQSKQEEAPSDVQPDCEAHSEADLRQACLDDQLTEAQLMRRDQRPAGVPLAAIQLAEVRQGLKRRYRKRSDFPIPREAQTDDVALLLARIAVSEEGMANRWGMGAIYQVARTIAGRPCNNALHTDCKDGAETVLSALRRLSPPVSGYARPTRWRQYWTSTLPASGESPSRVWRECESANGFRAKRCEGRWAQVLPLWQETLSFARHLVEEEQMPRVCRGTAIAWGCDDCGDDAVMSRRNARRAQMGRRALRPLECHPDVQNRIWGFPPRQDRQRLDQQSAPSATPADAESESV